MWTVDKASWVHQQGFEFAIFWKDTERGSFKSVNEAQAYCDKLNQSQGNHYAHIEDHKLHVNKTQ